MSRLSCPDLRSHPHSMPILRAIVSVSTIRVSFNLVTAEDMIHLFIYITDGSNVPTTIYKYL